MISFRTMKHFQPAGYSKEIAKEVIRISNECGRSITTLTPFNNILELENAIRKMNTLGYWKQKKEGDKLQKDMVSWIENKLQDKEAYKKIISVAYNYPATMTGDYVRGANLYSWKDNKGLIFHQYLDETSQDFYMLYLKMLTDKTKGREIWKEIVWEELTHNW